MDDEGLPLVPPLPLSQPAVQAPHDIPDAPPSSKSTGGAGEMEESDMVISENPATASTTARSGDSGKGHAPHCTPKTAVLTPLPIYQNAPLDEISV